LNFEHASTDATPLKRIITCKFQAAPTPSLYHGPARDCDAGNWAFDDEGEAEVQGGRIESITVNVCAPIMRYVLGEMSC